MSAAPVAPPLEAWGLTFKDYRTVRAACHRDLDRHLWRFRLIPSGPGKYSINLLDNDPALRASAPGMSLATFDGDGLQELDAEHQIAMMIFAGCNVTPRESAAAHLLAVASQVRASTWWNEHAPPCVDVARPPPPTPEQAAGMREQLREAVNDYAAFAPQMQSVLGRVAGPLAAGPTAVPKASESAAARQDRRLRQLRADGADFVSHGTGWRVTGKHGVLAALIRSEVRAGHPMSDKKNVREDLAAAVQRASGDHRGS